MELSITKLCVRLQNQEVLKDLELHIGDGEFVALLGESGCGKSTLLKCIAGLLEIEAGEIRAAGEPLNQTVPERRGAVIVFQDLRLFPHMTAGQNIAFAMDLKKVPRDRKRATVRQLLEDVQLPGYENRRIRELSGGQMQRIALARALAAEPRLLLLDEPFTGLNEQLKLEMGALVKKLHREKGLTTILVTHNKQEALMLADKAALMSAGRILQCDTPENIFWRPASRKVAEYFGKINYIKGTVKNGAFCCGFGKWGAEKSDGTYEAAIRPFDIQLSPGDGSCHVADIVFMGETAELSLNTPEGTLVCSMTGRDLGASGITVGSKTGVHIHPERAVYFKAEGTLS